MHLMGHAPFGKRSAGGNREVRVRGWQGVPWLSASFMFAAADSRRDRR